MYALLRLYTVQSYSRAVYNLVVAFVSYDEIPIYNYYETVTIPCKAYTVSRMQIFLAVNKCRNERLFRSLSFPSYTLVLVFSSPSSFLHVHFHSDDTFLTFKMRAIFVRLTNEHLLPQMKQILFFNKNKQRKHVRNSMKANMSFNCSSVSKRWNISHTNEWMNTNVHVNLLLFVKWE